DLLRAFVSNRTRRKFAAFLITKPDGTIGFEFEPRAPRGAAKAGAAPAAKGAVRSRAEEPRAPAPVAKKRAATPEVAVEKAPGRAHLWSRVRAISTRLPAAADPTHHRARRWVGGLLPRRTPAPRRFTIRSS